MCMYKTSLFLLLIGLSGCMSEKTNKLDLTWENGTSLPQKDRHTHIGVAGPITGLFQDRLLIAAGANFPEGMPWEGGKKAYQKEAYIYRVASNGDVQLEKTIAFMDSLAYSANVSTADAVYSIGGEREGQATANVFRYDLTGDVLTRTALADLPQPLTNAGATYIHDRLYLVGGENTAVVSDKVYTLDLTKSAAEWEELITLPYALSNAVVTADETGNLLIAGGRMRNVDAKSTIYDRVLQLNVSTNVITDLAALPYPLAAGTGLYFKDNLILFGGDNAATFHQVEEAIVAVDKCSDLVEKEGLIAKKNSILAAHPGFGKEVWALNLKNNSWYRLTDIVGDSPVTTTAVLRGRHVIIPSGEIRAGVRTEQILVGKLY